MTDEPNGDGRRTRVESASTAASPTRCRGARRAHPDPGGRRCGVGTPLLGGDQAGVARSLAGWKPDGAGLLFLSLDQVCGCPADPNVVKVYQVDTTPGLPVTAAPDLLLGEDRHVALAELAG